MVFLGYYEHVRPAMKDKDNLMDKLRKTIIRCVDFSAAVLFAKRIYCHADCILIIGFIAAYLVGSDAVEDVISRQSKKPAINLNKLFKKLSRSTTPRRSVTRSV